MNRASKQLLEMREARQRERTILTGERSAEALAPARPASFIEPARLLDRNTVLARLAEAGVSLAIAEQEYEGGTEAIPYPRWSCWDLFNDPELVRHLACEFLTQFADEMENAQISAVSFPAWRFLSGLETELRARGATILYVPSERRDGSRLVLFDLNINTGRTMAEAYEYYLAQGHRPASLWVLLFNDFLPAELRPEMSRWVFKQLTQEGAENLRYLYRASEVAPCFKSEPLAKALQRIYRLLWDKPVSAWNQEEREAVEELRRQRELQQQEQRQRLAAALAP